MTTTAVQEDSSAGADVTETPAASVGDAAEFSGTFSDLGVSDDMATGLASMGYERPTEVQASVFEPVTSGNDVIVQSKTGSGKTCAFCLPVLEKIDADDKSVQAIALCPTRELANQVATEARGLGSGRGIGVTAIYGGANIGKQIDELEAGAQMVVGTPGRVMDLIRRGHLKTKGMRFAILDEADEMLSMGFWDEVTGILDQIPGSRQTLLFSATLPPAIERAAKSYLKEPQRIDLSSDSLNVDTIDHCYVTADDSLARPRNFLYMLEMHKPKNAIVFCNRRDETELVTRYLGRFGFRAASLNGDMAQNAREKVLARVKAGELDMMVATDVAARGIDISDLSHVFNYDLPEFDEVYVHRSGRTGRIGKKGVACSLVRGKYMTHLTALKRDFGVPFTEIVLPDEKEIMRMQSDRIAEKLQEEAEGVEVAQYLPVVEEMMNRDNVKEIMAFLVRSHFKKPPRAPREDRGDRDDGPRESRGRGRRDRDEGERSERRPREDREERDAPPVEDENSPHVKLYVTVGREDGLDDLIQLGEFLAEMSGVDVGHFTGEGDVRDQSSHIEVDREVYEQVVAGVHGKLRPGAEEATEEPEEEPQEAAAEGEEGGERRERRPRKRKNEIICEKARPKRRRPRHGGGGRGRRDGGGGRGRRDGGGRGRR